MCNYKQQSQFTHLILSWCASTLAEMTPVFDCETRQAFFISNNSLRATSRPNALNAAKT